MLVPHMQEGCNFIDGHAKAMDLGTMAHTTAYSPSRNAQVNAFFYAVRG